ncbi:MAG: c-type cytochrome [Gemmatimonadales bacterium]|jgi:mono/diheme cytochrome c family protein|nr:MAG: c-type cytochrome [Gemmatimonadales bacterium]
MPSRSLLPVVTVALMAACGGAPEEAPESGPSAADSVQAAMAQFDPAGFDTVTWASHEDAVVRGSVVFSYSCARCHGRYGEGDGGFVTQGDTLRPPDFTVADWRFAEDLAGLREFIYVGAEGGMPHWGLEGLRYKDVDAVAKFLQDGLNRGQD